MPGGSPTKYKPEFCKLGEKLYALGATDREVAAVLRVNESSLIRWAETHSDWREMRSKAKTEVDLGIVNALRQRAMGMTVPDCSVNVVGKDVVVTELVKHLPPDVNAASFWLRNRQQDRWKDRQENHVTGDIKSDGLASEIAAALISAERKKK